MDLRAMSSAGLVPGSTLQCVFARRCRCPA